jgi:transcriptional regulator with XRE-family HTH domain
MPEAISVPEFAEPEVVMQRLNAARRLKGWSWTELARRAGVSNSTLSDLSKGHRTWMTLRWGTGARICRALTISIDALLAPWREDLSSVNPPGSDAWPLTQPEREAYIMRLTAQAEMMRRLQIDQLPAVRRSEDGGT